MVDDNKDRSRDRDRSRKERSNRFSENSRDRSVDRGNKDRGGANKASNCRVYVSNVPYEYRWQELKDLFRKEVGDVSFVELFVDENEKPRGCGIVEFSEADCVKRCLEVMHRFEIKGRKLVIKEDFGNQRDKYGNLIGKRGGGGGGGGRDRDSSDDRRGGRGESRRSAGVPNYESSRGMSGGMGGGGGGGGMSDVLHPMGELKWGNTYGLSPQFLESLWITPPLLNRVFVANLDYKVDKRKLKEVFRLAGKVERVELSSDKDGKSRGFAIIEYDHPVEAVQAISMFHNQALYDRLMTVRMDRESDRATLKLPDGLQGIGMGLGSNGEPLKDVARNLPASTQQQQQAGGGGGGGGVSQPQMGAQQQQHSNGAGGGAQAHVVASQMGGAGLLGAMPNATLSSLGGVTNALSNLNSAAMLQQAANLAGVGGMSAAAATNLLANSLGSQDLSQLAAAAQLVGGGGGGGGSPMVQSQAMSGLGGGYGRHDVGGGGDLLSSVGGGGGGMGRQPTFESDVKVGRFSFGSADRDTRQSGNLFGSSGSAGLMLRSGNASIEKKVAGGGGGVGGGGFSKKILINNYTAMANG